jgi:hypothetical protein
MLLSLKENQCEARMESLCEFLEKDIPEKLFPRVFETKQY